MTGTVANGNLPDYLIGTMMISWLGSHQLLHLRSMLCGKSDHDLVLAVETQEDDEVNAKLWTGPIPATERVASTSSPQT